MHLKRLVTRSVIAAIGFAAIAASAVVVAAQWEILKSAIFGLKTQWLGAGIMLLAACYGILACGWWMIVRALGGALSPSDALRAFSLAQLPKYVPGKIAGHGVRVTVITRAGVSLPVAIGSIAIEGALGLLAALAVAGLGSFGRNDGRLAIGQSLFLVVAMMLLVVGIVVLVRRSSLGLRARLGLGRLHIGGGQLVLISTIFIGTWFAIGTAYWLLANAVAPASTSRWLPVTVAAAVATGLGQLAFVAPGGIGIREGALYLLVHGWMGDDNALVFVALTRIVAVCIETLLTAAAGLHLLRGGRPPSASGASPVLPAASD